MDKNLAIKLTKVTKKYIIHHEKPTLVEKLIRGKDENYTALRNINLKIKKGERVGIIGKNGSGKTTLLKIISGITSPTSGKVECDGKIVSLIDLEAGFHPDLTGIQNIYLSGMILGMSKGEIKKKLSKIIEFAGIDKFIDTQIFTYSEGMKLRLGLAVAIYSDPEILIFDESMLAGDIFFQKKLIKTLKAMLKTKITVIMVSHWLPYIKSNCERIVLLEKGRIIANGGKKVIDKYLKNMFNGATTDKLK